MYPKLETQILIFHSLTVEILQKLVNVIPINKTGDVGLRVGAERRRNPVYFLA